MRLTTRGSTSRLSQIRSASISKEKDHALVIPESVGEPGIIYDAVSVIVKELEHLSPKLRERA